MRGSIDRIEENIAVIVWDSGKIEETACDGFKEGDRVVKARGIIKKVSNDKEKREMIDLQNRILRGGNHA